MTNEIKREIILKLMREKETLFSSPISKENLQHHIDKLCEIDTKIADLLHK